ncbi:MAG: hypothetical protein M1120_02245 [Patescibacteria group bacterium]|nr:hypothetical protein [Patescibacteria group bacterium]
MAERRDEPTIAYDVTGEECIKPAEQVVVDDGITADSWAVDKPENNQ